MEWFKKKGMIDIRELQKNGNLLVPREDIDLKQNKDGYVELSMSQSTLPSTPSNISSNILDSSGMISIPESTSISNSAENSSTIISESSSSSSSPSPEGFLSFFDTPTSSSSTSTQVSQVPSPFFAQSSSSSSSSMNSLDQYSKREVDMKIEKMDSLVYQLEQRIAFLEKKLNGTY